MDFRIRDFIAARLDERETAAKRAIEASGGEIWRASDGGLYPEDNPSQHPGAFLADYYGFTDPDYGDHIALHDPTWTLRDITAKRQILGAYDRATARFDEALSSPPDIDADASAFSARSHMDLVLRLLAAIDADHSDFNPTWKLDVS